MSLLALAVKRRRQRYMKTYNHSYLCLFVPWAELGRELWTTEQLSEEWRKVMFTHAASPRMWAAFIGMGARPPCAAYGLCL